MNGMSLPEEVISSLQLQKECIGLQLEERIAGVIGIGTLVLAFLIAGITAMYYWYGPICSVLFLIVTLLVISSVAFLRKQTVMRIRKEKTIELQTSQALLKSRFLEMTAPTDTALFICQAIRTISDILHEVKKLFKEKG